MSQRHGASYPMTLSLYLSAMVALGKRSLEDFLNPEPLSVYSGQIQTDERSPKVDLLGVHHCLR